jgi:hypothetical protein
MTVTYYGTLANAIAFASTMLLTEGPLVYGSDLSWFFGIVCSSGPWSLLGLGIN